MAAVIPAKAGTSFASHSELTRPGSTRASFSPLEKDARIKSAQVSGTWKTVTRRSLQAPSSAADCVPSKNRE